MYLLLTILFTIKLCPHIDIFKANSFNSIFRKVHLLEFFEQNTIIYCVECFGAVYKYW